MDSAKIRSELDQIIKNTTSYDKSNLPNQLLRDLAKWRWGSYGWVSPASLMFTAAWRKYYYPDVDCCKIWAADENNRPIPGGYSIRTEDETISIKGFVFVLESRDAATDSIINEMVKSAQLSTNGGEIISIMSLFSLYQIALPIVGEEELVHRTSKYMSIAPAVKPETKDIWLRKIAE